MAIDPHSLTWKAILQFIEDERENAVSYLIADRESERQRGVLAVLERLETLERTDDPS